MMTMMTMMVRTADICTLRGVIISDFKFTPFNISNADFIFDLPIKLNIK